MEYSGKYTDIEWTEAPGHPKLLYAENGDLLIMKYFRTHIITDWERVERVIELKNESCGKTRKPNPAAVKRGLKSIVGEPHTSNKLNAARLFVRLVAEGAIQKSGGTGA